MYELTYTGLNSKDCSCDYVVGTVVGQPVLVIKSTSTSFTRASYMVEDIATKLLAGPLFGTDAMQLRMFIFYPPEEGSLATWQEAVFETIEKHVPKLTGWKKFMNWLFPSEQPWIVRKVHLDMVPPPLQRQLSALDPTELG